VDDHAVEDDRAVADQHARLDATALEMDDVSDHAVVADGRRILQRRVQHAVVLDRCACSDGDLSLVAAEHRARPDRAVGTDPDGADDDRVGMNERVRMDDRNLIAERVDGHVVDRNDV
jgi:hypothetical protein